MPSISFILSDMAIVSWEWVILFHLWKKAQEQFDEEEAKKLQKKIAKNQFNFDDFLAQIKQIKKMGMSRT